MGKSAPGRHGLRHRALQPAQVVHAAARRRRPGLPARSPSRDRIEPYLPRPQVVRVEAANGAGRPSTWTSTGRSRSAGCAASRATSASSCAPTPTSCSLGGDGLTEASETAVLNANYLLARAEGARPASTCPDAYDRRCMHEFVLSGAPMKSALGHPRRSTSPSGCSTSATTRRRSTSRCVVDEALMIEPTETETRETLDAFAEAIAEILARGGRGPGDRPQRAVHDAGPPAGRGRRRPSARSSASRCSTAGAAGGPRLCGGPEPIGPIGRRRPRLLLRFGLISALAIAALGVVLGAELRVDHPRPRRSTGRRGTLATRLKVLPLLQPDDLKGVRTGSWQRRMRRA